MQMRTERDILGEMTLPVILYMESILPVQLIFPAKRENSQSIADKRNAHRQKAAALTYAQIWCSSKYLPCSSSGL